MKVTRFITYSSTPQSTLPAHNSISMYKVPSIQQQSTPPLHPRLINLPLPTHYFTDTLMQRSPIYHNASLLVYSLSLSSDFTPKKIALKLLYAHFNERCSYAMYTKPDNQSSAHSPFWMYSWAVCARPSLLWQTVVSLDFAKRRRLLGPRIWDADEAIYSRGVV